MVFLLERRPKARCVLSLKRLSSAALEIGPTAFLFDSFVSHVLRVPVGRTPENRQTGQRSRTGNLPDSQPSGGAESGPPERRGHSSVREALTFYKRLYRL